MNRAARTIGAMALVAIASACGSGGSSSNGRSATLSIEPPPSSPAATAPAAPTGVTGDGIAPPTPSPALPDGRSFGYIRSIDVSTSPPTMVFDLAYFLTGDAANEAAAAHGDETPVPNDYYIVNDNPRLRTLVLDPDVRIRVVNWPHCCDPMYVAGELAPFVDAFEHPDPNLAGIYRGTRTQYWLTVRDGVVVKIQEQFVP